MSDLWTVTPIPADEDYMQTVDRLRDEGRLVMILSEPITARALDELMIPNPFAEEVAGSE